MVANDNACGIGDQISYAAQREQAPSLHVIITDEKSVLDYLLKPVLKARTEAMRER
ncbi:hypothetical protein D3C75_1255590 [compost metagenome]